MICNIKYVIGWTLFHLYCVSLFESTAMALPRLVGGEVMGGKVEPSIPHQLYTRPSNPSEMLYATPGFSSI